MNYLNSNDIINLVYEYLEENIYNYAIMIDGDWGSGKTFFVKESLISGLKEKFPKRFAIYVSLYGISNTEDISSIIYTTIAEVKCGKGKKLLPLATGGFKIVTNIIANKLGASEDTVKTENLFSFFIDYSDYYFIFDDLERCSININDVMGYMNYFVEQNNSKVIIIANEQEIRLAECQNNIELKYLIAIQDKIDWPKKEQNKIDTNKNGIPLDIIELKKRNKYLFNENELYLQIKEKLIGKTISYRPNINEVVESVFEKFFDKNNMDSFKMILIDEMINSNHYNIRTLQFSLIFFSKIVKKIYEQECVKDSKMLPKALEDLLLAIIKVSIRHKNGLTSYTWIENSEYGTISFNRDTWSYKDYFRSFKFVHDYIYSSEYNEEYIIYVFIKYIKEKEYEEKKINDPSNKLQYYWEMEDVEIEKGIETMYHNLKNREYNSESYRWILSLLYEIKGYDIEPVPIKEFVEIMKSDIFNGKSIHAFKSPAISKNSKYYYEYTECINELNDIENDLVNNIYKEEINSIFDMNKDWGEAFYKYYKNKQSKILSEKNLFKSVNVEKCIYRIRNSSVKDINDFSRGISDIYNFSNVKDIFVEDKDNLLKLKILLKEENITGKMKNRIIELLIEELDAILNKMRE